MLAVYKYEVPLYPTLQIPNVPSGARFLSIIPQGEKLVAYFLVDPPTHLRPVVCFSIMTGQYIDAPSIPLFTQGLKFAGTFAFQNATFILHTFVQEEA
jgi:hypothetical protein